MENKEQSSQEQSQRGRKSATLLLLLILLVTITVGFAVLSTSLNIKGSSAIADAEWCVGPQCNNQCTDAENANCGIITCPPEEHCIITDCNTHPDHCTCDQSTGMCTPPPVDCTQDPDKSDPTKCTCNATTGTCIPNPDIWLVGDTVYFHHTLEKPRDVFTFNTKYTNGGNIDAKVSGFTANNFANTTANKFLSYSASYSDNTAITVDTDELASGASATFKVTVAYKDVEDLPTAAELAEINQMNETGYAGAYSSFQVTYAQK